MGGGPVRPALPAHAPGMRVGLFGGSFNPPHAAHRAVSLFALKRLGLDRVWWLVTPGNPLKDTRALPPLVQRLAAAEAVADHPRLVVTGLEAEIRTRYTLDTLRYLTSHCPGVRFVWVMGLDNLRNFHHWRGWKAIMETMPVAVVDRGGIGLSALASPAAQAFAKSRIPEPLARLLPDQEPPAWVLLHGFKSPLSSTALRGRN
ncbi:MAG TPA: nicotinate-nucleotide adenylyltransferase [Xanthobacteraceae bacterium]